MRIRYRVELTELERLECRKLIKSGKNSAEQVQRARILLKADTNGPFLRDTEISLALECSTNTIEKIRRRFVERGFQQTLHRKRPQSPSKSKLLDGRQEAQIIALRCGEPPKGYGQWSLRLLSKTVVEREICDAISHVTVSKTLKKMVSPSKKRSIG